MLEDIEFEPRMSASDALMWRIEKDPLLRSTIMMIMIFDLLPDRKAVEERMERVTRVVPRLRQRVLGHPYSIAPPRWEVDANFDLRYHLRWVRVTGAGDLRELLDLAEPMAMQGFDRARPLWEFTIVEGLEAGRSALIGKVHHTITDGVGGIRLQMELLDLDREVAEDPVMPQAPEPHEPNELERWRDALVWEASRELHALRDVGSQTAGNLRHAARDPVGAGRRALQTAESALRILQPATAPLSPLMVGRSLSIRFDALTVELERLKRAGKVVAGTLNHAFVAAVTGGLRRYHHFHGHDPAMLRMTMPINIRTDETAGLAGNRFVPARFPVPVSIADPIQRMSAIRELTARWQHEPALGISEPIANLLTRLPVTATTALFGSMLKGIDFVTTNVPGPPVPVYVAGARMERQIAYGPMIGAATNITLLSYCDDLNIGISTDPTAIPDPDRFVACLRDGFTEVTDLA